MKALGVLWIDAHPDVQTTTETTHAHPQVLGMLIGRGDPDFVSEVEIPVEAVRVRGSYGAGQRYL